MEESELITKMEMLGGLMTAMAEAEAEFERSTKELSDLIEDLKTELRTEFLSRKEGFTSPNLVAKYRKGAVRWDSAGLKIYAKDHPELEKFRKVGEPTVAFSLRKEEEREPKDPHDNGGAAC